MGLSSNVLWHQTRKEAFFEILKSKKLCVSYSQEEIMPKLRLAFPMICLCDLPLSEFASNNWTYGEYAIGFKRDWAIRNGFNPVCYYHHQPNLMQQMFKLVSDAKDIEGFLAMAIYLLSYYKPIEGQLVTSKREYHNYRFYDEREYRMVPYFTKLIGNQQMLSMEEYASYKEAHGGNSILDDISIEFDYSDINYIVVRSDSNVAQTKRILGEHLQKFNIIILTKLQVEYDIIGSNHNIPVLKTQQEMDFEGAQRIVKEALRFGQERWKKQEDRDAFKHDE